MYHRSSQYPAELAVVLIVPLVLGGHKLLQAYSTQQIEFLGFKANQKDSPKWFYWYQFLILAAMMAILIWIYFLVQPHNHPFSPQ